MDPFLLDNRTHHLIKKVSLVLWILIGALYLGSLNSYWHTEGDSAVLIMLAKSIAEGKGYTYLGYPHLKYPIGFPLLLTPIIFLWGKNFLIMNILILLFALTSVWATYVLFRHVFTREYAMLIAPLTGLSYLLMSRSTYIMTDVPYMALSIFALVYLNRYLHSEKKVKHGMLAAAFVLASYFVRTIGISIIFGFVLHVAINERRISKIKKTGLLLFVILIPVFAWNLRNLNVNVDFENPIWQLAEFLPYNHEIERVEYDDPTTRIIYPRDILKRIAKNVTYTGGVVSSLLLGQPINTSMENLRLFPTCLLAVMGLVSLTTCFGFCVSLFKGKYISDLYFVSYMSALCLWPHREIRFLLPVLPFVLHYFIVGITWFSEKIFTKKGDYRWLIVGVFWLCHFQSYHKFGDLNKSA